ncbi:hypothetical protein BKA65DRAFT_582690 [Rhexocercosporidium sp. MPI-PUGE-AT-0058]|nr:hypothetical protein BKA65DRAFT_582690 [Rhexocercosporidium sp. MPI-PUGE-AT-0058]
MSKPSTLSAEKRNVIIIGAGMYGLVAAKTYLQINPDVNLTICIRVYACLVTDLPSPAFELSDLQMSEEFGMPKWADIPRDVMHEYLERYSKKFDILRRIQFRTEVLNVTRSGKGWELLTKVMEEDFGTVKEDIMTCDVLLVATGLHSRPKMPDLDISAFQGIVIHARDLHKCHEDIISENIQSVVVLIREDGASAGMLLNAKLASVMEYHSPTLDGYRGWWDRFYLSGRNRFGTRLFYAFWNKLTEQGLEFFDPSTKASLSKSLEPRFLSINGNSFQLTNGTSVEADAVIFATGWQAETIPFFSNTLQAELGLPAAYWDKIDTAADKQIMDLYPIFATAPTSAVRERPNTQFRLLRTIIPPKLASKGDRSIVFLGHLSNTLHGFFAETSTLWAIAYLEGLLPDALLGTKEDMDKKVALENAFMLKRYPGRRNILWCVLEIRDWMDVMLKELGVRTNRGRVAWKKRPDRGFGWWGWRAWFHEWFVAYEPVMYKEIVDEFLERVRGDGTDVLK